MIIGNAGGRQPNPNFNESFGREYSSRFLANKVVCHFTIVVVLASGSIFQTQQNKIVMR
jgi:hypothetical protein